MQINYFKNIELHSYIKIIIWLKQESFVIKSSSNKSRIFFYWQIGQLIKTKIGKILLIFSSIGWLHRNCFNSKVQSKVYRCLSCWNLFSSKNRKIQKKFKSFKIKVNIYHKSNHVESAYLSKIRLRKRTPFHDIGTIQW